MHAHGTAVLTEPTVTALPWHVTDTKSARAQWVAKSEFSLAKALATGNAALLPLTADQAALPPSLRCPDCHGTRYTSYDGIIEPCQCVNFQRPRYDYRRYCGHTFAHVQTATTPPGKAEAWVPCTCGIPPVNLGPYDGDEPTRMPWAPDCNKCSDTGWTFSHYIHAHEARPW